PEQERRAAQERPGDDEHDRHLARRRGQLPGDRPPAAQRVEPGLRGDPGLAEDADDRHAGVDPAAHGAGDHLGVGAVGQRRVAAEPGDRGVGRQPRRDAEPGHDAAGPSPADRQVRHGGGRDRGHHSGFSTRATLWPPNANDVDTAGARPISRGSPATTSTGRSVPSWLAVGGTTPRSAASSAAMASTAPAAPMRWPMAPLFEVTGTAPGPNTLATAAASALSLCGVDVPCALTCPMLEAGRPASASAISMAAAAPEPSSTGAVMWWASQVMP